MADPFNIDENEYAPYPQSFDSPARPIGFPLSLNDPFHSFSLPTINESEPQPFPKFNVLPPVHRHDNLHESVHAQVPTANTSCSVCGRSSGALAILEPCEHPLCSACLTSALNIVGEKDMECAVCKLAVEDFHLQGSADFFQSASTTSGIKTTHPVVGNPDMSGKSFLDALVSPTVSPLRRGTRSNLSEGGLRLLPSAFDAHGLGVNNRDEFFDGARGASTPVPGRQDFVTVKENVVLRVDNVPWVCYNFCFLINVSLT